jgi:pimeloyl-ACP methyl ester carboxylesterase
MVPETKYARSGDVNVAYQIVGDGPLDLVLVPGWVSNIDVFWEEPKVARFLRGLAGYARLILFDKRGTGLSDRVTDTPTLEERMDDVRAVMDAAGSERAALVGYSEGGPMCALFAATYPERTTALVMIGSYARRYRAPDYLMGPEPAEMEAFIASVEQCWGTPFALEARAPSALGDERFRQWWARYLRMSASPAAASALTRANWQIDVRHVLPTIRVPTLVLHATGDLTVEVEHGRYLAAHIPGAELVEFESDDHLPWLVGSETILRTIQEFLTGAPPVAISDRILCTIMFTDIVGSTEAAVAHGDQDWTDLLDAHHDAIRIELEAFHGREINTTGDGFVAVFDGPARAIQCAVAAREAVRRLGLDIRVGLHTGECEVDGDTLTGVALHVAARVSALAPSREVLVSRTVKDLVAGSGIAFEDFGVHDLKGVPDDWQLYRVVS